MSLFGMILFIAWVGICLGAGRVNVWLGFWAFVVAVVASVRVAGEASRAPIGQARRALLTATSGVVVTAITGSALLGLAAPVMAVSLSLTWVDSWLEFTSMPRGAPLGTVLAIVSMVLLLGGLAAGCVAAGLALAFVAEQLWEVAPHPVRGGLATLGVVGVWGLVLVVGFGLGARMQAVELGRRVDRIAGWAEAARRERAAKLRLLGEVGRGPETPTVVRLRAEADHAGKVVRAEEDRAAELRAEWRQSWASWRWLPWASALAALALVALAVRWARRRGGDPTAAAPATWIVRLPSHRVPDRGDPDLDPREVGPSADPLSAEQREAPTRSWPAGLA